MVLGVFYLNDILSFQFFLLTAWDSGLILYQTCLQLLQNEAKPWSIIALCIDLGSSWNTHEISTKLLLDLLPERDYFCYRIWLLAERGITPRYVYVRKIIKNISLLTALKRFVIDTRAILVSQKKCSCYLHYKWQTMRFYGQKGIWSRSGTKQIWNFYFQIPNMASIKQIQTYSK